MNKHDQILETTFNLASSHLKTHRVGKAGTLAHPLKVLEKTDLDLKAEGLGLDELVQDMKNYLDHTTNTLSPYFMNQLFSGMSPYALAADWLASMTNTTMATYEASPMGTLMEKKMVERLCAFAGWNEGDGIMVTGGSNANMVGMLMARNTMFPEAKNEGLVGKKLVAFVSEEAHYSFDKGANLMGLGVNNIRKVPANADGKMKVEVLDQMIQASIDKGETPFFVAATAGTTVLGVFDPLKEIKKITDKYKLWFHVDGAWGGSVLASPKHRHLMDGIESADSLAWDTHKMLGTGLISSFYLTKHKNSLRASHDGGGANYIFHESEMSSWNQGPGSLQCGRRVDSFKVWLMWRALGDNGVASLVETLFEKAQLAKNLILKNSELELLYDPEMLNICFRFKAEKDSNRINTIIRETILKEGQFYVNMSTRDNTTFFRMITTNPEIETHHFEELFASIIKIGRGLK